MNKCKIVTFLTAFYGFRCSIQKGIFISFIYNICFKFYGRDVYESEILKFTNLSTYKDVEIEKTKRCYVCENKHCIPIFFNLKIVQLSARAEAHVPSKHFAAWLS